MEERGSHPKIGRCGRFRNQGNLYRRLVAESHKTEATPARQNLKDLYRGFNGVLNKKLLSHGCALENDSNPVNRYIMHSKGREGGKEPLIALGSAPGSTGGHILSKTSINSMLTLVPYLFTSCLLLVQ